jgi:DNA-binding Lrp family transcriptional regulator
MDKLDTAVIRELIMDPSTLMFRQDIRRPYESIAKKLNVSEDTIRNRVKALEEGGPIRGWKVGINPNLLGYRFYYVVFDVKPPAFKDDVYSKLKSTLPGLMWLADYFGDHAGIVVASKDEESLRKVCDHISSIAHSDNLTWAYDPYPKCNLKFLENDWKIVASIQRNPRKPYSEIASELGLSTRTVRRRLERMLEERALFSFPDVDFRKLSGSIVVDLVVFYTSPEVKQSVDNEVVSKFRDNLIFGTLYDRNHAWYLLVLPNLTMVEEVRSETSKIPGAKTVYVFPIVDFLNLVGEVFQADLHGKVSRAEPIIESSSK